MLSWSKDWPKAAGPQNRVIAGIVALGHAATDGIGAVRKQGTDSGQTGWIICDDAGRGLAGIISTKDLCMTV